MVHARIEQNPEIMFGKPVVRGTRITVELILRQLAVGITPEGITREYPQLTIEDVHAAAAFAADLLAEEDVIFAGNAHQ